jgi:hypothetical protein
MDKVKAKLQHVARCWRPAADARNLYGDGAGMGATAAAVAAAPLPTCAPSAKCAAVELPPSAHGAGRIRVLTGVRALALL